MSKQRIELNVESRETGRKNNRALRVARKVPAVVYGATENQNLYIEENTVRKYNVRAYENALFNLKSGEGKLNNIVVLMKEVVVHPVTRRPTHVDLFALDMKKTVRVDVEVRVEGKPVGLADGGLLNLVNRSVEIECLPTDIPEFILADVSHLGVGDALHASDLKISENVKLLSPVDMTIAVVNIVEEEVAAPAADAAAAPAAGATPAAAAPAAAAPAKDKK